MVPNLQPDALLLVGDVARMINLSTEMVRKLERAGRISALRTLGGHRIFRGSDVLRLQQERTASDAGRLEQSDAR